MARTPKVWTVKQAYAYADKNSIYKFLVKRNISVTPPIKKRGHRRPKQIRGRKKNKPLTIFVGGGSRSGNHHEA